MKTTSVLFFEKNFRLIEEVSSLQISSLLKSGKDTGRHENGYVVKREWVKVKGAKVNGCQLVPGFYNVG